MSARGHVLEVLAGASTALGLERDYINDLNVYPVPDGDTGTNLFLTMQAVIDEVEGVAADDLGGLMAVVIRGSLMGARGNSGVILSQIVRGACESIAAARAFDSAAVRDALHAASDAAYRAVRQPVEGTMLSVIRAMSEAAAGTPETISLPALLTTVATAGAEAVERTIDQLEALRRAGVVDAGGYGLLVLLRGAVAGFLRAETGSAPRRRSPPTAATAAAGAPRATSPASRTTPSKSRAIATARASCCSATTSTTTTSSASSAPRATARSSWAARACSRSTCTPTTPAPCSATRSAHGTIDDIEVADMREQTRAPAAPAAPRPARGLRGGRRRRGQQVALSRARLRGRDRRRPVHEPERRRARRRRREPRRRRGRRAAQQRQRRAHRRAGRDHVRPQGRRRGVDLAAGRPVGHGRLRHRLRARPPTRPPWTRCSPACTAPRSPTRCATPRSTARRCARARSSAWSTATSRPAATTSCWSSATSCASSARNGAELITILTALNGCGVTVADLERTAAEACATDCPLVEFLFQEGGQPLYPILIGAE